MRTVYSIKDVYGETIAEHVRVDFRWGKKIVSWQVPGMPQSGLLGLSTPDLPLYGSEHVGQMTTGQIVVLCEGEKATDAVRSFGIDALGTVTGASVTPGEDALALLLPFDVVTWEDYDEPGAGHMQRVARTLLRLGGRARRLRWGYEKGDDAADFLERGGTRVTLARMLQAASPWVVEPVAPPRPVRPAYVRGDGDARVQSARSHLLQVVEDKLGPYKRKMGRSLFWPCPFHTEKSPSFKVDLAEPFYVCFGCGARGDVFTFLREIEGVEFKDALHELAPPRVLGGIPRLGA